MPLLCRIGTGYRQHMDISRELTKRERLEDAFARGWRSGTRAGQ